MPNAKGAVSQSTNKHMVSSIISIVLNAILLAYSQSYDLFYYIMDKVFDVIQGGEKNIYLLSDMKQRPIHTGFELNLFMLLPLVGIVILISSWVLSKRDGNQKVVKLLAFMNILDIAVVVIMAIFTVSSYFSI